MLLNILKSLLIAIAGVFLLLFPSESLNTVLFYLGIAMVCYGAFTIISFFTSRSKEAAEQSEASKNQGKIISLVLGILVLICGIVVLAKTELVIQFAHLILQIVDVVTYLLISIVAWSTCNRWVHGIHFHLDSSVLKEEVKSLVVIVVALIHNISEHRLVLIAFELEFSVFDYSTLLSCYLSAIHLYQIDRVTVVDIGYFTIDGVTIAGASR